MVRRFFPFTRRRGLAWMLWLALLIPPAQVGGFVHALSHAVPAAADAGDKSLPHGAHCDLCLSGQSIDGAAPPAAELPRAVAIATEARSRVAPALAVAAPRAPAYSSRAPPADAV